MTTNADVRRHSRTFVHVERGGPWYSRTRESTISLLSMLHDVLHTSSLGCRPYPSFFFPRNGPRASLSHARDTYAPRKRSRSDQRMNGLPAGDTFLTDVGTPHTIHLDPPVRSIGTTLKKRSRRSIVSNHDRLPHHLVPSS